MSIPPARERITCMYSAVVSTGQHGSLSLLTGVSGRKSLGPPGCSQLDRLVTRGNAPMPQKVVITA